MDQLNIHEDEYKEATVPLLLTWPTYNYQSSFWLKTQKLYFLSVITTIKKTKVITDFS